MIRADKSKLVDEMHERFNSSPHAVLASYSGLTVNAANDLRRKVDAMGGRYTVIKNRLAKRAAKDTPIDKLADQFSGPCALVTHGDDPVGLAKTMTEFIKDNPAIELKAAVVDGVDVVDADGVKQLSKLPGLPELRAQLLALFNTPATQLVRLVSTPGTQIARVIDAKFGGEGSEGGDAASAD